MVPFSKPEPHPGRPVPCDDYGINYRAHLPRLSLWNLVRYDRHH
jgi:hypothetical protein